MDTERFISHLPAWKAALLGGMTEIELEEARDRDIQQRIVNRRSNKDQAARRREQARARKLEAQALYAAASKEYQQHLKEKAELKMTREAEQEAALDHGIVVKDTGPPDIVRDIQWVYDNWRELYQISDNGTRVFDTDVLEEAPSSGAITMAEYGLRKPDGFVERFVIKLLPKDAGETEDVTEQTDEERMKELDPSFEDMKDFFGTDAE
jgi:hypothetical protein